MHYLGSHLFKFIEIIVKELFRFENKIINYNKIMKTYHERMNTRDPRLMRIFITAIFQNISEIFGLCVLWTNYFINAIFMLSAKYSKNTAVMK